LAASGRASPHGLIHAALLVALGVERIPGAEERRTHSAREALHRGCRRRRHRPHGVPQRRANALAAQRATHVTETNMMQLSYLTCRTGNLDPILATARRAPAPSRRLRSAKRACSTSGVQPRHPCAHTEQHPCFLAPGRSHRAVATRGLRGCRCISDE
jgi:hypothetical protein